VKYIINYLNNLYFYSHNSIIKNNLMHLDILYFNNTITLYNHDNIITITTIITIIITHL